VPEAVEAAGELPLQAGDVVDAVLVGGAGDDGHQLAVGGYCASSQARSVACSTS